MTVIKVPKKIFLQDLDTCLTVIKKIKSNLFECEYISPALYVRVVYVSTF